MDRTIDIARTVFGIKINDINATNAVDQIIEWSFKEESKYVCFCNSHTVYEANRNQNIKKVISEADLVLPDGFPLVIGMRMNGAKNVKRIAGPDLMLKVCDEASKKSQKIFLYGSDPVTLKKLKTNLENKYKKLKIVGVLSPPYRNLTKEEKESIKNKIIQKKPNIIFVGLGFPKQEIWMNENKNKINSVMLGVGAAFDFHGGSKKRAPKIMQNCGLEWLWRFLQEPRRLGSRYLRANTYIIKKFIERLIKGENKNQKI